MLIENTLLGTIDKVQIAIERLKQFEPPEGYYLAFSGGKDSICIYQLALMSGVKFDAHFNWTSVDPPELVKFIRAEYPDVSIDRPKKTMWELIIEHYMFPTRIVRFCCQELKERGGINRWVITGVRSQESAKRKNRPLVHTCKQQGKTVINPIIDWTEKDVWQFIRSNNFKYPGLYDEGYKRIGCIMCPMKNTKGMQQDAKRFPNYYKAYLLTAKKLVNMLQKKGLSRPDTDTAEKYMTWWIYGKDKDKDKDRLFEEEQTFNFE